MKTPMQELMDEFAKKADSLPDTLDANAAYLAFQECYDMAKSMLEKEKEVMYRCYKAHRPITMIDGNGKEVVDGNHMKYKFDNYYNETFNTKEK